MSNEPDDLNEYPDGADPDDYLAATEKAARAGYSDPEDSIWEQEDAISSLKMDRAVLPDMTPEEHTKKMLEQAGPLAASRIIHLALNSNNDNTSLAAARYITDKFYGDEADKAGKATWEKLLEESMRDVENHANQGQA